MKARKVRTKMCSEYQLHTSPQEVEAALGFPLIDKAQGFAWGGTVKMYTSAPVIELGKDGPELVLKTFPSSPMPNSRLSGIGNQSEGNDADEDAEHIQIKRIYEMPRWKEGFHKHPLLIPMSSFHEFAYWGSEAGTAQDFTIPGEQVLFAAGIGIRPFTPSGKPGDGFSILTHTATEQMLEYHHRLIVLLKPEHALQYLEESSPEKRFEYLVKNRYTGEFEVTKVRNMAAAWKGRKENQLAKLQREQRYLDVIKKEGVEA